MSSSVGFDDKRFERMTAMETILGGVVLVFVAGIAGKSLNRNKVLKSYCDIRHNTSEKVADERNDNILNRLDSIENKLDDLIREHGPSP